MAEAEGQNSRTKDQQGLPPIVLVAPEDNGYWPALLAEAGIQVQVVDDIEALSARMKQSTPPVLLIDFSIDSSGLSAIRDTLILKNTDTSIFVVAMVDTPSHNPDDTRMNRAFEFGAQDVIAKGDSAKILAQRIRFIYRHAVALRRLRSNNRSQLDSLREGQAHWLWDMEHDLVYVSDAMRYLIKAGPEKRLISLTAFLDHFSGQQRTSFERALDKIKEDQKPTRLFQVFSAGPLKGAIEHVLQFEPGAEGHPGRIRGVARLREDQEQHRKRVFARDRMTGLPNEDGMLTALDNVLEIQNKRDGQFESGFVGLMVVDVDRFKRLAAIYGREASDEAVRQVATRLKGFIVEPAKEATEAARQGDKTALAKAQAVYLSCLGRDEFAFLMTGLRRVDGSAVLAEKLVEAFRQPFKLAGEEVFLTLSMGIAISPVDGDNSEDLLKHARAALSNAKGHPSSGYQFYSPSLAASEKERHDMETMLRQVLSEETLRIQYQPQVEIETNQIMGVEALVRWDHPAFRAMTPDAFIALAEEVGLISELGEWVLRQAIDDAKAWSSKGQVLQMSVNISAGMFKDKNFYELIDKVLKDSGFNPEQLTLELTEGMVMADMDVAVEIMKVLKERGVQMSLDDFGTGYSSLSYLKSMPFDHIKIDRSFIRDMVGHPQGAAMVRAIMEIAKTLDISVVAEGVETEDQLEILTKEGCSHFQGFLCSGALDADDLLKLVEERQT